MTRTTTVQDIQEQRRETRRIVRRALERGRKPIRKFDTLDARYIVREKRRGTRNSVIAGQVGACVRHVQRIWRRFRDSRIGDILYLPRRPGRHSNGEPGRREHSMVVNAAAAVPRCAGDVYRRLNDGDADRAVECHTARDVVHRIMLAEGRAREESGKKRQRRYVRYERRHSNTLWHADYTQLPDGRWLIMYEDDSSRFVTGWGVFENATSPNAIAVFEEACGRYGAPYSVLTDHGTQFYAMESTRKDSKGYTRFERHVMKSGIRHILARVGHPQTNGKIERLFREYKHKIARFTDVAGPPGTAAPFGASGTAASDPTARFVEYHNSYPHRSLHGQSPSGAFEERKIPEGESHQDDE